MSTDISAAVKPTSHTAGTAKFTLDSSKALESIQKGDASSKTFIVMVPETDEVSTLSVSIPDDVMQAIGKQGGDAASIIIATQYGDYRLPLKALEGNKGQAIEFSISQVTGSGMEKAKDNAVKNGLTLLGGPVDFKIESVDASDNKHEIESFGNVYVARSLHAGMTVDDAHTAAVKVNEDGSFMPVPTYFTKDESGYAAVIQRPGNSSYAVISGKKDFADTQGFWAEASISKMASHLLVNGMTDTSFEPQSLMTRAQFTSLMVRALGLSDRTSEASTSFTDVSANDWFAKDVNIAVSAGLIEGYGDQFGPQDSITREQLAAIFTRAMKFVDPAITTSGKSKVFADADSISSWAASSVNSAVQAGILEGDDQGNLRPGDAATRAEATVMLERMLQAVKFIN
ncbi:S-layer homology domain-containing protein [Paenibacillus hexagrammi]|uniref:S-layer homology domain-containing protein n=1 Tax=Paenibacillus hexagrammi TaxID=2908839 RepID=A0ABY3SPE4_9BACL|nr:S-layer homology domain-containing protein [Paenibacillus sp. YPD9-1]UJF34966.1 S-layer homology domain-containing protein [Paenibacillus sp. YPD9-1]